MIILGIETSCDETAASVIDASDDSIVVLSNVISSQIEIHKKYGGVIPEVAAREHVLNILPVVNEALLKARIARTDAAEKLSCLAVTVGPGLITSLQTGVETAKVLASSWKLPIVAVNHIAGHIGANYIGDRPISNIKLPAIVLTVSGGHTMLVLMKGFNEYEIIGETRDDAAGEAFDKVAKLMDIGYPGGPVVSKLATEFNPPQPLPLRRQGYGGQARGELTLNFPRPMLNKDNFDFSFSGLKTALRYALEKDPHWRERIPEYCHEFEQAVVETLVGKTMKAATKYRAKTMMLAGGVSANNELRWQFLEAAGKLKVKASIPDLKYTTDNAAMIAAAAYLKAREKRYTSWQDLRADCNFGF